MSIDFGILEKASGKAFQSLLNSIPESISESNVKKFYDISLKVLNNQSVKLENKGRIIIALCKTIGEEEYLSSFIDGNYLMKLPFDDENLRLQLFDVFYIIASNSPSSITKEAAQKLEYILPSCPRRS